MEKEIWKKVDNYDNYEVSNFGSLKRNKGTQAKKERVLKPIDNGNGYMGVSLCKNGISKRLYVHRLVAKTFLQNQQNKPEVNHKDGNTRNNKLANLEWVTKSENENHKYKVLKRKGVNYGKTGSKNWLSKKVIQKDLNGNFIKQYSAVMEAMRQTGIGESNIRCSIYGKQKTAGGYKWEYLNPR